MFDLLIKAFPAVVPAWEEHIADWDGEHGSVPYISASVFSRHIVGAFEAGETTSFPSGFGLIEKLVEEGNDEVRGITIVGILEGIQNAASWKSFGPRVFIQWLGPRSREAWDELESLWAGKQSLADVLRDESRNS